MEVPSTYPDCGESLKHTRPLPGGIDTPMEVTCSDCGYEATLTER